MKFRNKDVYLDGAANTPLDPLVYKAMKPFLRNYKGNSYATHSFGIDSLTAIETARGTIARHLGVKPSEVYFTSGATEANNWVIYSLGVRELTQHGLERGHIVCSATEHSSVLRACQTLAEVGFKVDYIKPNAQGRITSESLEEVITDKTLLVCIMSVNNETGVLNDVEKLARIAHTHKALFLNDCTQAMTLGGECVGLGRIYPESDYLTFSAHKIYGPTGVGCLVARSSVPVYSFIIGGAQEHGFRGGTHNTAGIVGMAKAIEIMAERNDEPKCRELKEYLEQKIDYLNMKYDLDILFTAMPDHANIISLNCSSIGRFTDLSSLFACQGVACSSGAACDAEEGEDGPIPSHVLLSMGIPREDIGGIVRLSFTKMTTTKDLDRFIKVLDNIIMNRGSN